MLKLLKLSLVVLYFLLATLSAHSRERLPDLQTINSHSICNANIESCKSSLKIEAAQLPIYVSRGEGKINTIIILVHGMDRNANEYLHDFISQLNVQPVLSNMAVIAPHFLQINDPFEKEELRWNEEVDSSWKYGYKSVAPVKLSSFQAIDHLIKTIDEKWHPKKIIIAGHSAGAQFVQRYANGSQISKKIKSTLTFVVSNPSSYLYSRDVRLIDNNWEVPTSCPEYNNYIYGLNNRNEYLKRLNDDQIENNYLQNNLIYLIGEEDKLSDDLDMGCKANLQGSNRFERAVNFFKFLNEYAYGHRHQFLSVPGVGHDHIQMFSSRQFLNIISQQENIDAFKKDLSISHLGNQNIQNKSPQESYFLMGGGDDIDEAFLEFIKASDGGDILILSAQKTPIGYDRYLLNLAKKNGLIVNSVSTVLIHTKNASEDPKFLELIAQSEGIFFSGGDQWNYVSRIKGTLAHKEILKKLKSGIPFGGTSAGLAILGGAIFTAELDTVSTDEVFNDPLNEKIKLMSSMFNIPNLENILTDTHFRARDRMGRLISFQANWFHSHNSIINGLGVDEDAVLVLKGNGLAHVIGPGAAYLLTPTKAPQIDPQHFMWQNIEVRKKRANEEFSLKDPGSPNYFFNVENGKIISSQNDGAIY